MATISGRQGSWQVDVIVNETAIDINANTSTASWELWIRRTDGGNFPMYGTPTVNIYISGQHVYSESKYYALGSITNSGVKLESGTVSNLPHNNETGVINSNAVSFTWTGSGFSPNNVSGSGTYQTATIPRNSTITATSSYVGETSQLTITRYKDEYTHSIHYTFGNLSGYILANGSTTSTETKITALSIGFPIPTNWYAQMPNNSEKVCTLLIKTYNGNTQIGNDYTATFYVRVNQTTNKPTITASVSDANNTTYNLTGNRNILVKGVSTASVTWSATPKNSATIKNVKINGTTVTTSPYNFTLNSNAITVVATDSRDLQTSSNVSFTLKDYFRPSLTISSIYRASPTNNFATIKFNGSFFNKNFGSQNNTLTISWKYRETGTTNWTNGGNLTNNTHYKISGNNFWSGTSSSSSEITIGGSLLSYEKNWDILIQATDKLTTYQAIGTIAKGIPIINWEEDFFNVNGDIRQNNISIFDRFNYSTTEVIIGKWINNEPIYRKVIEIGYLPSNNTTRVNHNISNLEHFTSPPLGLAIRSSDNDTLPIPYVTFNANNNGGITIYADETNVVIRTTTDRSSYYGYVVLEYTKTTD